MPQRIKQYALKFSEREMVLISDGLCALRRHHVKIKLEKRFQKEIENSLNEIQRKLLEVIKK